jgi:ribosomal protein S18 acetylase RimI-like enzyme
VLLGREGHRELSMMHRATKSVVGHRVEYRSVSLFSYDLKKYPVADSLNNQMIEYRAYGSVSDPIMTDLAEAYPARNFEQRMTLSGQQCYVALEKSKVLAFGWVSTSPCYISEVHMTLAVGRGRIYIYDCLVQPDHRGRGVYQNLLRKILHDYSDQQLPEQYRTAYICVEPRNTASICGIRRAGFCSVSNVRYARVGSVSYIMGAKKLTKIMDADY